MIIIGVCVHVIDLQRVNMRLHRQKRSVRTVAERPRERQLSEQPTVLDFPSDGQNSLLLLVVGHAVVKRHRKRLAILLALTHTP